jgi:hypothetical protein
MIKERTKKSLDDSIGVHVHKNREKPAFSKKYRNLFNLIQVKSSNFSHDT